MKNKIVIPESLQEFIITEFERKGRLDECCKLCLLCKARSWVKNKVSGQMKS